MQEIDVPPYINKHKVKQACSVHFLLDNTASDNLLIEEKEHRSIWRCWRKTTTFTSESLNQCMSDMMRCCLTHRMDFHQIHSNRLQGLSLIKVISKRTNYNDLSETQIVALLWSCLSVVHHFHVRVIAGSRGRYWNRIRQYRLACSTYERVLVMLLPQLFTTVLKCLIKFFNEAKMWELEDYITICIKKIYLICKDSYGVVNNLLDIVEICDNNTDAKNILKIIQNLYHFIGWKDLYDFLLLRFIELYRRSVMDEEYDGIRWALESCLFVGFSAMKRNDLVKTVSAMMTWVKAISPGYPVEFGKLMEYAAGLHNNEIYSRSLDYTFMLTLFRLITSEDVHFSLLGCRVLFFLLDRLGNHAYFVQAKLYCEGDDVAFKIGKYVEKDRYFINMINDDLQKCLLHALMQHGMHKRCMEIAFAVMAAIVVEVPCAFTAAVAVSFAMAAQEYVLTIPDSLEEAGYRIHASTIFIMSLVCYIHKVLYEYVGKIVETRARLAPQLNPPVYHSYDNHPQYLLRSEMYFEDWEVRYGLFCCFLKDAYKVKEAPTDKRISFADRLKPVELEIVQIPRKRKFTLRGTVGQAANIDHSKK